MNNIAQFIDHTILKPDATKAMVKKVCDEAKKYNFASVCVNPYYIKYVSDELKESNVKVTSVIGFPLGSTSKDAKAFEAKKVLEDGANEIDMVINIGAIKDRCLDIVREDIQAIVDIVKDKAILKVIIETCLLTEDEKKIACEISKDCGVDFVKTSTGFSIGGATEEDVKLMKEIVGSNIGVKASGGIRTIEDAEKMIRAGATRIGASSSVSIVESAQSIRNNR
ncbi:deoxyribose-phosphate aldolase DeoC [Gottschalkia acidurici 9a]|uniref:Deoxyribose-phosphate aldolase n=1 Tax=Gottschalkia acidurici (strain ATCC 7906 / DSM 604 / BCRC 14475 / CIP 104303 / KCTC 5404 / NCIMB 10678 / 9a) TaxID=1128398 RepID=K0AZQ6_GOTA9|nr:deoxyribose-phosphate aldolase [Gottschalkia acidurici]AFS78267.1 deoxyribose-phosphate aldolase DeoC [Gottschalkia acidurici 9a]